jgi:hypothetical protein
MARSLTAAGVYFAIIFALGFALGAIRVPLLAPQVGDVAATLIELPIMLAASWLACGWLMRRLKIRSLGHAVIMGAGAFASLMGAEAVMAAFLFGRSLADHLASYATPAGAIGLAGQAIFGALPMVRQAASRGRTATPDDTARHTD